MYQMICIIVLHQHTISAAKINGDDLPIVERQLFVSSFLSSASHGFVKSIDTAS